MTCVMLVTPILLDFAFVFNDTATTEIYPLSLHDALPIYLDWLIAFPGTACDYPLPSQQGKTSIRSEEHTSELQSQSNLVFRPLLEKTNHSEGHVQCTGAGSPQRRGACARRRE